jgi:hypothetical protein
MLEWTNWTTSVRMGALEVILQRERKSGRYLEDGWEVDLFSGGRAISAVNGNYWSSSSHWSGFSLWRKFLERFL